MFAGGPTQATTGGAPARSGGFTGSPTALLALTTRTPTVPSLPRAAPSTPRDNSDASPVASRAQPTQS